VSERKGQTKPMTSIITIYIAPFCVLGLKFLLRRACHIYPSPPCCTVIYRFSEPVIYILWMPIEVRRGS